MRGQGQKGSRGRAWIALVVAVTAGSATSRAAEGPIFQRVGTESGPPSAVITSLYQDRAGFLWIGSRDGLTLYDGHTFSVFEHDSSDPASLSDNTVRTIYEDRDDRLWIGTNAGGLDLLDRATWTFRHFRHDSADPETITHDSVYAIVQDHDGSLWIGTQKGLNRFDPVSGRFERFFADPGAVGGLASDYIMSLFEDRAQRLWIGTLEGGLYLWRPESRTFVAFRNDPRDPTSLSDDGVTAILQADSDKLWIGTLKGLNLFDPANGVSRRFEYDSGKGSGLSDPLITTLAPGPAGRLWIGTHGGGLDELDTATGRIRAWRHDPERRGSLSEDVIIALLTDRSGALWIGTWGGGLDRLSRTALLLADLTDAVFLPQGIDDKDVTSLTHDERNRLWIGTRSGYVIRFDPANGESRRFLLGGQEGTPRIVQGLHPDPEGKLWISTSGSLLRLDPVTGELVQLVHDPDDARSLGPGYVRCALVDREGRTWVGTGEGGLQLLDSDGRVVKRFLHDASDANSLSDDYVTALLEDHEGTLWVGTRSGGLNAVHPETNRVEPFVPDPADPSSISHHDVSSILQDSRGRLWVGTSGGGLNLVLRDDGGRVSFRRYTEQDGLIDNDVMAILEDVDDSLWLSTKRGLARFDPDADAFASIYVSDGLPSAEFEPGSATRSGTTLYFGSVKGVVAIPLGTSFPRLEPSPTVVASVRTAQGLFHGDRPSWSLEHLKIPWGEWLSIELAVLDYNPEQRHHYAYDLDDDTVDLGQRREITFTGLAPGIHEFSARGRNSQGVWNAATPALRIEVVPPFWMTRWFRGLILISLVSGAIGVHQWRLAAVEKRNRELLSLHREREKAQTELSQAYERLRRLTRRLEAAKEDERLHIARELHDELGPALTAVIINLQLLGQVSDPAVRAERIADAIDLVDRLVQRVRDLSLDLRPPLLEELGLLPALKGYLEAQADRTGLEIDVRGTASGLPPELEIAAFRLVQEAVTNAIRHARAKRVEVRLHHLGPDLELHVKDDGRGFDVRDTMERAAAGKAIGLLGMQERVRVLGGEFEIDSAPGRGTEIRVRLPVEERG